MMARRRQLYEGKAKVLFEGPEPGTLVQYFKDDASSANGTKKGIITGKGRAEQPDQRIPDDPAGRDRRARPTSSAASTCASS